MLRLDATEADFAALRAVLERLRAEPTRRFAALFDPEATHVGVELDRTLATPLVDVGLVQAIDPSRGVYGSIHRIRVEGPRLYVMELGTREYRQDVWPETDAMLAELADAPLGTVLDMGTGCGIVALEARARGHRVVATDVYDTAISLAQWNARLNRIDGVEFRCGHLFEPVAGEQFDLVLTAPHYTRTADQLRIEALHAAPAHIAAGGRLTFATFFEWFEGSGGVPAVDLVLRPLVARGFDVDVVALESKRKREWFQRALGDPRIPSRHRFLVHVRRGAGALRVIRPRDESQLSETFVPLARLAAGPRVSVTVTERADADALLAIDAALAAGRWSHAAAPAAIHDACRFGARRCVSHDVHGIDVGAAGAIVDDGGGVRPCSHGAALGRVEDSFADYEERLRRTDGGSSVRRGCDACAVVAECSRCLAPVAFTEQAYCAFQRGLGNAGIVRLRRFSELLRHVSARTSGGSLAVKTRPTVELLAARGRPPSSGRPHPDDGRLGKIAALWLERETWIVAHPAGWALFWLDGGQQRAATVSRPAAEIGELIADGATGDELSAYSLSQLLPHDAWHSAAHQLQELLSPRAQ